MRAFALTYPQLMNQASALGRPASELEILARTCAFAERMSDGLYRAQHVPLFCHLVRTASILLAEGEPCSGVQAGMLHASPVLHLFDKSRRRPPFAAAGRPLRREFGEEVDALVTEYGCVLWGQEERKRHLEALAAPSSPLRRSALRIRVANELEELLDAAMAYAHRRPEEEWQGRIEDTAVAAEKLDHPVLAAELREAWLIQQTSSVPETLRVQASESYERPRRHWREATLIERAARRLRRGRRADA